jgi:hypothetical protein
MSVVFSCEEIRTLTVSCEDCYEDDPTIVPIIIKVDSNYGTVMVSVYEGDIEDNVIYETFKAYSEEFNRNVPANRIFTVTATYKFDKPPTSDGISYIAVDAVSPHVKYDDSSCENPCYYVYNNVVNLRLKYRD